VSKIYKKKKFGQNFLSDEFILSTLVNFVRPSSKDLFLEIGPGSGNLTEMFTGMSKKFTAIEFDRDLIVLLKEKFKKEQNFEIINKNILDIDLNDFASKDNKIRLIGNLPYNMSSPILDWCFKNIHLIKDMHFMFQKEFAYRCAGNKNTKSYGKLSVICNYFCEVKILTDIDKSYFDPVPKVDSTFLKFKPKINETNINELNSLNILLNKLFNKKRKKILKTLKELFSEEELSKLSIDYNLRPDQLSLEDYISLTKLNFKNG
jgi:16S rRNA (adenine1518-N6/adenine1519-N6)-dimethyltransferase|tara:strand:- start:436 stop:1221 length:786 start_codon:yes stop_codon:yes gene_type:complete